MIDEKLILLVEDDPHDQELTLRAFAKGGVRNRVVVVEDGAQALDYLFMRGAYAHRSPREMPQVVLLDLRLPKVEGLEVLQALRAHETTRRLPVVVLTSSVEEQDLVRSYELGANSFVRKPVAFNDFIEAARQLGLYWLVLNEPPPA